MINKVYIAGGWFSPEQLGLIKGMEKACVEAGLSAFSPRKANLWKPGDPMEQVVNGNIKAMTEADFILASTEGKDMGTLWECGYAYCENIPVIYYYPKYEPFNIMLAATAHNVVRSYGNMSDVLIGIKASGVIAKVKYRGEGE